MTIPKWKPDPLPERRGRQLTDGRIINLWMQGSYTQNAVMTISVSHLFLDTMDYALGTLMLAAVADTLGTAKVEPRGMGKDFEITWPVDDSGVHDDTPGCIYDFLKACATHPPTHDQERGCCSTHSIAQPISAPILI